MILINDVGLIGDAIGTIPFTIELSKLQYPLYVSSSNKTIYDMIPKKYGIKDINEYHPGASQSSILKTDLSETFNRFNHLHMTQAHFGYFGLPIPAEPIRPELDLGHEENIQEYDFLIAPFSRSLPEHQLWPLHQYVELAKRFPKLVFCAMGSLKPPHNNQYVVGYNIGQMYDEPLNRVGHTMKKTRYGLISIVTGLSHFAHALEVPNIQLTVQGAWGNNPDALRIGHVTGDVRNISVDAVEHAMRKRFNL